DLDITTNTENARHLLLAYLYGAWDYVKNSGKFPEAENLAMNWVGSVPGRRESRRFMGDYIVTEKDLTEYRHFDDTVAFAGGWSLDEHCPGAILNPTDPASFFHQGFTKHTEIPYRALYSKNIDNLMFAGRNYSCSHIALSGTRLIAMCAQMGQAAGTAATICVNKGCTPRGVYQIYMNELQEMIMRDDAYIPNRPAADPADLARKAKIVASSTASGDVKLLVDGISRDEVDKPHHWRSKGVDSNLVLSWDAPQTITSVEIKCDTDLQTEIQLHPNKAKMALRERGMPEEMVKAVALDVKVGGGWKEVASIDDNLHRLIKLPVESIKSDAVRIRFKESYGVENLRIFEVRCY
ncbi:MAG: FAD-dependent oxidoreductase, partial [Rikenellaceae bacterium]